MTEMTQSRIAQPVVRRGLMVLGADLIYVFVPVIVTVFVICEKAGRFRNVIASPEWAFAAAILIGQAGAKLLAGAAVERNLSWQPLVLIAALLFMLEAMALTVLLLLLTSEGHSDCGWRSRSSRFSCFQFQFISLWDCCRTRGVQRARKN